MKVGIYIGTDSDPAGNVAPVLRSWKRALTGTNTNIELYGASTLPESLRNSYKYIRQNQRSDQLPQKIFRGYQYTCDYIKNHNPDAVMQIWKYATHSPGVALAGKRLGVPTVGRFTGDTFNEYRGLPFPKQVGVFGLNNINGRLPLHFFDKLISLGPYGRSELSSRGVSEDDIHIIPPPVPSEERFSPPESTGRYREDLGIPREKTVFLYVGRMTSLKGMEFLRETISKLSSPEDFHFLLIGSGPYQSVFTDEFNDDIVHSIGRVNYNEIDKYYKLADCYIQPSPYEGLPLVILEALSCGTPVLARPAGDIPFVTENLAENPNEMVSLMLENDYTYEWKNRELFEPSKQQALLIQLLNEIT